MDEVTEKWIEVMLPNLRDTCKQLLSGASVISFQCGAANQTFPNGQVIQMPFYFFAAPEVSAVILQSVAEGIAKSSEIQKQLAEKMQSKLVTQ